MTTINHDYYNQLPTSQDFQFNMTGAQCTL